MKGISIVLFSTTIGTIVSLILFSLLFPFDEDIKIYKGEKCIASYDGTIAHQTEDEVVIETTDGKIVTVTLTDDIAIIYEENP